ncbi:putative CND01770-like [Rosellinia necatrix]|uniref:Putative CND01770-like n=1 Tax=Rosellinia necatrix TaxID=77044 RepID=A0A1W2TR24_ROSNE|nr:putative CND01770-like [Rosellinia necatrix]
MLSTPHKPTEIISGRITDYAVPTCRDGAGNIRCTALFPVKNATCYTIRWRTEGVLTHTTAEVRSAVQGRLLYYRDTNGDWTPDAHRLVYLDFMPKVPGTGNSTVAYRVTTCE